MQKKLVVSVYSISAFFTFTEQSSYQQTCIHEITETYCYFEYRPLVQMLKLIKLVSYSHSKTCQLDKTQSCLLISSKKVCRTAGLQLSFSVQVNEETLILNRSCGNRQWSSVWNFQRAEAHNRSRESKVIIIFLDILIWTIIWKTHTHLQEFAIPRSHRSTKTRRF